MFSARPTTTRVGLAVQMSTMLKTRSVKIKSAITWGIYLTGTFTAKVSRHRQPCLFTYLSRRPNVTKMGQNDDIVNHPRLQHTNCYVPQHMISIANGRKTIGVCICPYDSTDDDVKITVHLTMYSCRRCRCTHKMWVHLHRLGLGERHRASMPSLHHSHHSCLDSPPHPLLNSSLSSSPSRHPSLLHSFTPGSKPTFSTILPTVDFFYLLDCLTITGPDRTHYAHHFIFSFTF